MAKAVEYLWKPFTKQALALSCPAFELGYGGAPGGGKSDVLLVDPLQGLKFDGFKALLLRRKYTDLERSLIVRSHELYRGRGSWDGQNKRWKFAKNCSVEFGHCQRPGDIYNYQSAQYSYIGIEQVEQFTDDMYRFFFSRIRTTNPEIKPKFRCNFNPGGVGHNWLKQRFKIGDPTQKPSRIFKVKETLTKSDGTSEDFEYDRAFIPATVYDNVHIMKNDRNYLMRLMQLPEPQRTAYLEGRFDLFEGQFFTEWDASKHVCKPFDIPKEWRKSIAFDWGFSDPTCALWFAEDPKTNIVYCYRELYINRTIDIEVARQIEDLSRGENIYMVYYPWDLDNKNSQTGVSMHERMDDVTHRRFCWRISNKDRKNGWAAVRHLLSLRPDGRPRIQIFDNCRNLIETIPQQIFDDTNSEDLDSLANDHACLVADTKISMATGEKAIQDIRPGDLVVTRNGFEKVTVSKMTDSDATVYKLKTTVGEIRGTANHPFFLATGERVSLCELKENDLLLDVRPLVMIQFVTWKLKSFQTLFKNLTDKAIGFVGSIFNGMEYAYIGSCGNIILGQFLKNSTFTTGTITDQAIKSQTLNFCQWENIFQGTQEIPRLGQDQEKICSRLSTQPQLFGTDRQMEESSILGLEKLAGKIKKYQTAIVTSVIEFIKLRFPEGLNFVISIAKWLNFVPAVRVLELKRLPTKHSVFNLTVEPSHEYIANGFLVSNCDALRYFSATYRTLTDMDADVKREKEPIDLGGAFKMPDGKFVFKKEPAMSMAFLSDI